jgi:hypothetical protein
MLKLRQIIWLGIVVCIVIIFILASKFTWREETRGQNQHLIEKMFDSVNIGDTKRDVESALKPLVRSDFILQKQGTENIWAVAAPPEIMATNWVLMIGFNGERVVNVSIRTADGPHPQGARPDK